jgi:polysaccharide deacetylase 2 family uncharacterized protein YibQ
MLTDELSAETVKSGRPKITFSFLAKKKLRKMHDLAHASTSRIRVPFPIPPKEGLQLISPMVSNLCVSSIVFAPVRADAAAASHPA